jgi:hypothetical protein
VRLPSYQKESIGTRDLLGEDVHNIRKAQSSGVR